MVNFALTVSNWVKQQESAMVAVTQEAAQDLSEDVTKPRAKGGRMPVSTGFLRNSLTAAINSIPSGEGSADGYSNTDFDAQPVVLVLNQLRAGDRLVLGFTANYAERMERRYFFTRSAAQNWPTYVNKAVKKISRG